LLVRRRRGVIEEICFRPRCAHRITRVSKNW
jgi:hypothetical protein